MPVTPTPSSTAASGAPFGAPFAGVLLDLDGTLIDSIAAVERSWIRWCCEYGIDPVKLLGFHGIPAAGVIETLLPEGQRAAAFERIRDIEVADVRHRRAARCRGPARRARRGRRADGHRHLRHP